MENQIKKLFYITVIIAAVVGITAFSQRQYVTPRADEFPYRQAGLSERQAAAHLLSRFTYGATPGEIDAVVKTGLEKWFAQQLEARLPDDSLNQLINRFDAVKLSNQQIVNKYPRPAQVLRMAVKDGVINKDSVKTDRKMYRSTLQTYLQQNGMAPEQELFRQFINQKVFRAAYSNNQLQEVMTDFWFNHFNVSITKNSCAVYIPSYERDVIRPNVFGKFGKLLLATAKSPAMLVYLDNFSSTVSDTMMTAPGKPRVRRSGLNENYAREVMELHTLGVDGGYSQQDVTQAARILTGWTLYPMDNNYNAALRKHLDRIGPDNLTRRGFVHDGDFLFVPNRHDNGKKRF